MDYNIVFTARFREDLRKAVYYIAEDNPDAAFRVGEGIIDSTDHFRHFPVTGRLFKTTARGDIREIPCWGYRIFFRVDEARGKFEFCISDMVPGVNPISNFGHIC